MWHASIALANRSRTRFISTVRWGEGIWRDAQRRLWRTLEGVGAGESIEQEIRGKLHLRRSLSTQEIATISAEWLAIPAVDGFTEEDMRRHSAL